MTLCQTRISFANKYVCTLLYIFTHICRNYLHLGHIHALTHKHMHAYAHKCTHLCMLLSSCVRILMHTYIYLRTQRRTYIEAVIQTQRLIHTNIKKHPIWSELSSSIHIYIYMHEQTDICRGTPIHGCTFCGHRH